MPEDLIGAVLEGLAAGQGENVGWLTAVADQLEAMAGESGSPVWAARRGKVDLAAKHLATAAHLLQADDSVGDHLVAAVGLLEEVRTP